MGWPYDQLLVENSLQLLEWPGEYYYDPATGYLYYYPRANSPIENQEIIAPKIVRMVGVVGTSATAKVQNIQFVGLTFMGTDRGNPQVRAADWGCTEPGAYEATVYLSNAKKIKIQNCRIACSGVNAVTFDFGTDTTTITGCLLEHSGYNGILTRTPCSANTISNSIIRYAGEIRGHGLGISLTGGEFENSLISHLSIYYTSRAAIGCSSGGNTIEYITMHDNVQDSGDQGAVYLVGCPYDKPNTINQCVVRSTYSDFCQWDRGPTGFYNDRNAPGTTWSNCDAGDRVATGAGDHQWWSFRHDVQDGALPILFKNCSWAITYSTNYQYSRTPNASFNEAAMEYSKIGVTSVFPIEFNDLASKPTTPVGLWIQKGNTEAMLRWTQADRATNYTVKRAAVSGGPYTNVGTVAVPTKGYHLGTEFLDKGLVNDSTYFYVVTASDAAGESDASVELSVTPDSHGVGALTGKTIGTVASPGNAFDGNLKSVTGSVGWVGLDLGEPRVITGIEYTPTDVDGGSIMRGAFEGSNDPNFASTTWLYGVASTKLGSLTSMRIPQAIYNKAAFRYVRFVGEKDGTVGELKFFGKIGDGLLPVITSDTIAKGRVGTALNYTIVASNSPTSYNTKDMPAGLSLDASTGAISGAPTIAGISLFKIIANNAYGADTATLALTVAPKSSGDLVAYYKFDQCAADSSGNAWDAKLMNEATYAIGKTNSAVTLDGVNDYVSMPSGLLSSVSNMTISTWVKLNAATSFSRIFDFGTGTGVYMFLTPSAGGFLRFAITQGGNGKEQAISSSSALPTGAWTHVAVTLNGSTGTLYVNGASVGTNSFMSIKPSDLGNTTLNYIGRSQFAGDAYLNGLVDDFKIYGKALTAAEVKTLAGVTNGVVPVITNDTFPKCRAGVEFNYTISAINLPTSYNAINLPTGFVVNKTTGLVSGTVSAAGDYSFKIIALNAFGADTAKVTLTATAGISTSLIAHYTFNQNADDSSGNSWNATLNNGPVYATGKYSSAVSLNGTNNYVSLPTGVLGAVANMTITAWVKPTANNNWSRIFDFGSGTTNYMFLTPNSNGTNVLRFGIKNTSTATEQAINSSSTTPVGAWTHVAVVLSGSTGTIYINGVSTGTNTAMTIKPSDLGSTNLNYIGRSQFASDSYYNGLVDDVFIYGEALSAADINSIMNGAISATKDVYGNEISLYPNPVRDLIHIDNSEGATVQIYSALGTMVHASKILTNDQTIDLSKLTNGIYFVKLIDNGVVKSAKVIKN